MPVPCFSLGHSCLFSQLHLVLKTDGAAGLKPEIITVEDGSGVSHQLPWLKLVPTALGEKLLVIKLLPVRRASWKLSAFNILMKSIIKNLDDKTSSISTTPFTFTHAFQCLVRAIESRPDLPSWEFWPHGGKKKKEKKKCKKHKVFAVQRIHVDSFWEVTFHLEESVHKEGYSGITVTV